MTVVSTIYSIDLTGVTAQNSAITTAIVSALQTASVGPSVSTFSVQDSADTITPQREFKISSAGTSFQIQFTRQDETTTVSLTDNLNIFTSGATNLTTIRATIIIKWWRTKSHVNSLVAGESMKKWVLLKNNRLISRYFSPAGVVRRLRYHCQRHQKCWRSVSIFATLL